MYSTAGGYADVIAFRGGRYISTFTFPNISAALLNNTLLSCLDILGDENNEIIYLAGMSQKSIHTVDSIVVCSVK